MHLTKITEATLYLTALLKQPLKESSNGANCEYKSKNDEPDPS